VLASSAVEGVKRVIIASSSSVYGQSSRPTSESDIPDSYSNFYPLSKRVNEMTAKSFGRYGLETVSLRYFNTYGIGENSKGNYSSVIWKFIDDIRGGRKPVIYGDGKQRRDFIYVRDTARASVLAMENGRDGEEYNIGTGRSVDFNTIFKIVKEETGYEGDAVHIPNPLKSYQLFTQAVMKKSNDELKFFPEYDVRKGVREMIESVG
jgi:UDP-glucose 4-epimerase